MNAIRYAASSFKYDVRVGNPSADDCSSKTEGTVRVLACWESSSRRPGAIVMWSAPANARHSSGEVKLAGKTFVLVLMDL